MWFSGFLSTVMMQFVIVGALIITQFMLGAIMGFVSSPTPGKLDPQTMLDIVQVAFLWFIVRIPSLLATSVNSPLRTVTEAGGAMSQAVGASIAMQFASVQAILSGGSGVLSGIGAVIPK
jgi:hypothetical protein